MPTLPSIDDERSPPLNPLKGQILIASPLLGDPSFAQTVVLMVQHDAEGALGLVLNRPLDATLDDVWDQVSVEPCFRDELLHLGGPCDGPLMVLHNLPDLGKLMVVDGVYFSAESDALEALAGESFGLARFFLGYAGWGPGQLEEELAEGAWLTTDAASDVVFGDSKQLWEKVIEPLLEAQLAEQPRRSFDPTLN